MTTRAQPPSLREPGIFIALLLLVFMAERVSGQGLIVINNRVTGELVAPIYGVVPEDPTTQRQGNDPTGIPAGTQNYGSAPRLSGTGFTFALFGGPQVQAVQFVGSTTFRTGTAAGFVVAGYPRVTIPGVSAGESAVLQVRAWDNEGGTITTWEQAVVRHAAVGWSAVFTSPPLGGTNSQGASFPVPQGLFGMQSFSIPSLCCPNPLRLSSGRLVGQDFRFEISGSGQGTLSIQAAQFPSAWQVIGTLQYQGLSTAFTHTNAAMDASYRFYRARLQQTAPSDVVPRSSGSFGLRE